MASGKVTPDSSSSNAQLPLGWTQIKRSGKRRKTSPSNDGNSLYCCDDPSCPNEGDNVTTDPSSSAATARESESQGDGIMTLKGKALFCLHSLDCTWFQGQFVNSNSSSIKSLGLLAKQREDVDDCLQCSDGGYREIDLTILSKKSKKKLIPPRNDNAPLGSSSNSAAGERKQLIIPKLTCTGGDMLRIRTPPLETQTGAQVAPKTTVSFDADQIITGVRVEALVRRYFPNLLPSISEGSFLEQLPDCAVVVGNMSITLPKKFVHQGRVSDEEDDDDDWLE